MVPTCILIATTEGRVYVSLIVNLKNFPNEKPHGSLCLLIWSFCPILHEITKFRVDLRPGQDMVQRKNTAVLVPNTWDVLGVASKLSYPEIGFDGLSWYADRSGPGRSLTTYLVALLKKIRTHKRDVHSKYC